MLPSQIRKSMQVNVRSVRHSVSGCLEVHSYASGQMRGRIFASSASTVWTFLYLLTAKARSIQVEKCPKLP